MRDFQKNLIHYKNNTLEALEKINKISNKYTKEPLALFVLNDDEKLMGTLTDGDIRRGLLNGKTIHDSVTGIMKDDIHFLKKDAFNLDEINALRSNNIKLVPVLDEHERVVNILDFTQKKSLLPLDAVIMAGGKGMRLRPLTDDTPKPLLEIGDKPIISHNIDHLNQYGIDNLVITVNYLGHKLIKTIGDGSSKEMNIRYVQEHKPLGTIGSLSLVDEFFHDHILLMNSDLLTTIDLYSFYKHFMDEKVDMAVASIPYQVKIPYAVLDINETGIRSFKEKPEYTYYSNAGIYLLKKELVDRIPKNTYLDATDFMEELIDEGKKVTYFPVLGYWLDIGRHEDLEKARKDIKILEL